MPTIQAAKIIGSDKLSQEKWNKIINQIKSNDTKLEKLDLSNFEGLKPEYLTQLKEALTDNNQLCYIKWGSSVSSEEDTTQLQQEIYWKVAENLANYEYYPNDYILSLFSSHAYADIETDEDDKPLDAKVSFAKADAALEDWEILKVYNYRKEAGYYGMLYLNKKKAQLVLAHRGTDPLFRDLFGKGKQNAIRTDIETVFRSKIGPHQAKAYAVTLDAVNIAKDLSYNFAITGHSLGGFLAELSLYYCVFEFGMHEAKAVTFDSPGSKPMFDAFQSNIKNAETEVDLSHLNLVTYLSVPNPVNICNQHVGTVYALFPSIDNKASLDFKEKALSWLVGKEVLQGLKSVLYHSLDGIIEQFDEFTGKPKKYQLAKDWPYLERKSGTSLESLLPSEHKAIPRMVLMTLGDTTMASIVSIFYDMLGGKLDTSQFFNLQKFLEADYTVKEGLTTEQRFLLTYKLRKNLVPVNEQRAIADGRVGTPDWYLKKLHNNILSNGKLPFDARLDSFATAVLSNISTSYQFNFVRGKEELISKTGSVEQLKLMMRKAIAVIDGLELYIRDIHKTIREDLELDISSDLDQYTSESFVGRKKQLQEADQYFKAGGKVLVISGPPKIGKTSFAAQYGQINKAAGKLVIWFANVLDGYTNLATMLGLPAHTDKDVIRNTVNNKIVSMDKEVLFIFHKVEDYGSIKSYVDNLPVNVKLIITSRNPKADAAIHVIELPVFNRQEAQDYLKQMLPEDAQARMHLLVCKIGYSPFKLAKAANYLRENTITTISEYINEPHPDSNLLADVLFSKSEEAKAGWQLLRYMSYLGPYCVPIRFLKELKISERKELSKGFQFLESLSFIKQINDATCSNEEGIILHKALQVEAKQYLEVNPDIGILHKIITFCDKPKDIIKPLEYCENARAELVKFDYHDKGSLIAGDYCMALEEL